MNNKSKFVVFLLSFIPGLSHLYLGFTKRALIFLGMCCGSIAGIAGIFLLIGEKRFLILLPFVLLLIWFFALIDAMSLADKLQMMGMSNNGQTISLESSIGSSMVDNQKVITAALSVVPGAGHMYLGYLRQGVQLMAIFFFTIFLVGWLNMGLFLFIIPVVWFYSLFDALHRVEEDGEGKVTEKLADFNWLDSHPQWLGWGLIIIGCLVILERLVSPALASIIPPMLMSDIKGYLQTGIVAIALIAGGIKLLNGTKVASKGEKIEQSAQDDDEGESDQSCDGGE